MTAQTPFSTTIASFSAALRVAKVIARDLEELVRRRKAELPEIGDFKRATEAFYQQQQEEQARLEAAHQQARTELRQRTAELELAALKAPQAEASALPDHHGTHTRAGDHAALEAFPL